MEAVRAAVAAAGQQGLSCTKIKDLVCQSPAAAVAAAARRGLKREFLVGECGLQATGLAPHVRYVVGPVPGP